MCDAVEMPKYKCHKEVWALKIAAIDPCLDGYQISPAEVGYGRITVSPEWYDKHKPAVGGYYVVYSDGYKSFSPAKAFEDGYTRI